MNRTKHNLKAFIKYFNKHKLKHLSLKLKFVLRFWEINGYVTKKIGKQLNYTMLEFERYHYDRHLLQELRAIYHDLYLEFQWRHHG